MTQKKHTLVEDKKVVKSFSNIHVNLYYYYFFLICLKRLSRIVVCQSDLFPFLCSLCLFSSWCLHFHSCLLYKHYYNVTFFSMHSALSNNLSSFTTCIFGWSVKAKFIINSCDTYHFDSFFFLKEKNQFQVEYQIEKSNNFRNKTTVTTTDLVCHFANEGIYRMLTLWFLQFSISLNIGLQEKKKIKKGTVAISLKFFSHLLEMKGIQR